MCVGKAQDASAPSSYPNFYILRLHQRGCHHVKSINCSSPGVLVSTVVETTRVRMAGDEQPPKDASTSSTTAKDRLAQVGSHIVPNTSKRRRRRGADSDLPADYSDILGQLATLKSIAATPNAKNRGYVRQKAAGKLWVRERVDQLLDPGSFQEVGSVSGTVKWRQTGPSKEVPEEYVPSNNVQGESRISCHRTRTEARQVSADSKVGRSSSPPMTSQSALGMLTGH